MADVKFIGPGRKITLPRAGGGSPYEFVKNAPAQIVDAETAKAIAESEYAPRFEIAKEGAKTNAKREGTPVVPVEEAPAFPSKGFDNKEAVLAFASEHLGVELPRNKALKTLNREAWEAYVVKYKIDLDGSNEPGFDIEEVEL